MNRSSTAVFGVITASVASGLASLLHGGVVDRRAAVGWPDVWAVIKASAERRLGKPLLKAYFFLAVFGIVVVAVALLVMRI
jgi:hypothetical protein